MEDFMSRIRHGIEAENSILKDEIATLRTEIERRDEEHAQAMKVRCDTCAFFETVASGRSSLAAANERAELAEAENRVLREFFATAEPALCDCDNPDSCDAPICLSRKKVITEIKDILHPQETK